jgi:choline monooxygenase
MTYQFDRRLEFASTLPSDFYCDAAVLADENRNVFGRTWQLVGRAEQVAEPGAFFTATVAGEPLLIVRGSDDVVRAMSNVCRHRAGPVAVGAGRKSVMQCGYHGWSYALDGRLITAPELHGIQCFVPEQTALPQFRVERWNELLFVNLDRDAAPLREFVGELAGHLDARDWSGYRHAARKEWTVECNWKVYVDNYLEGYHIPIVHPGLFKEIDYPKYRTETRRNYSIQHAPLKKPERIRTVERPIGESGAVVREEAEYFWIYPNLMLNIYPDNFSTNLIVPLGHDRTLTIFEWYFRDPEAAKNDIDETIAFSDEIQLEDIDICEAVQRGLRSATYVSGRYSPQRENGVHHFHQLYAASMGIATA